MHPEDSTLGRVKQVRLCWLLPVLVTMLVTAGVGWVVLEARGQIAVQNQGYVPFSDAPIRYRSEDLSDPVAKLQQRLNRGETTLKYDPDHGYLRSVLTLLKVPIDSQTLVFSKTSFQYPKISPEHPRALYFNDDVYVGSVHEGKAIEIVSFDPIQGAIFYLLDEHKVDKPVFQRAELDCTQCHIAAGTRGVPGVLLRSVYPTSNGGLAAGRKTFITDQKALCETDGAAGTLPGILAVSRPWPMRRRPRVRDSARRWQRRSRPIHGSGAGSAPAQLADISDLRASAYLTPDSDVVAHLVLAHQTQMHNLITLTNYRTRIALYAQASQNYAAGESATNAFRRIRYSNRSSACRATAALYALRQRTPLNGPGNPPSIWSSSASSALRKEFAARGRARL